MSSRPFFAITSTSPSVCQTMPPSAYLFLRRAISVFVCLDVLAEPHVVVLGERRVLLEVGLYRVDVDGQCLRFQLVGGPMQRRLESSAVGIDVIHDSGKGAESLCHCHVQRVFIAAVLSGKSFPPELRSYADGRFVRRTGRAGL